MKNLILSAFAATALAFGATATSALADNSDTTADASAAMETLYTGVWTKKSFKSAGDWSIVKKDGKMFVQLSDDFRTRNAPDLKIFLSPHAAADATGKNATEGAVLVAPLSSNSGGQTYEIPAGVDLANFSSILIHCEAYSKLWSASNLT